MKQLTCVLCLAIFCLVACKKDDERMPDTTYNPDLSPANFSDPTNFTNPYFPMEVGKKYVFESHAGSDVERVEVQRLAATKVVAGITCVVVNDKVWLNDVLIEDTDDWYAQHNDGSVWYLGEYVDNFDNNGNPTDHAGSWEAGVDGAKAGIVMLADPQVGMAYRQEYYFNEAEDEGAVLAIDETVTTPFGTFENCIKTHDFTDLEPDVNEEKYFAPGIGLVKSVNVTDNEEELLVDIEE